MKTINNSASDISSVNTEALKGQIKIDKRFVTDNESPNYYVSDINELRALSELTRNLFSLLNGILALNPDNDSLEERIAHALIGAGVIFSRSNDKYIWDGSKYADITAEYNLWIDNVVNEKGVRNLGGVYIKMVEMGATVTPSAYGSCPGIPCLNGSITYNEATSSWEVIPNDRSHLNFSSLNVSAADVLFELKNTIKRPSVFAKSTVNELIENTLNVDQSEMMQNWLGLHLIYNAGSKAFDNENAMVLHGDGGTGKSSWLKAIKGLVGEQNACQFPFYKLSPSHFNQFEVSRAWLMDEFHGFNLKGKDVISGKKLTVDLKFLPFYDVNVEALMTVATNDKLDGPRERKFIYMDLNKYAVSPKNIGGEIVENELATLVAWALVGAERIIKNDYVLPIPESIKG